MMIAIKIIPLICLLFSCSRPPVGITESTAVPTEAARFEARLQALEKSLNGKAHRAEEEAGYPETRNLAAPHAELEELECAWQAYQSATGARLKVLRRDLAAIKEDKKT